MKHRPLVDFMIAGAQKCGTSALAHFLAQHPQISMSSVKEVHLFDAPDYSPDWTPQQIDERYRPWFTHSPEAAEGTPTTEGTPIQEGTPAVTTEGTPTVVGTPAVMGTLPGKGTPTSDVKMVSGGESAPVEPLMRGETTPIYLLLPEIAAELKRYNADLKLIVLVRDPVERAISHYYMAKERDYEHLPLWLALLSEPWRLRGCRNPRATDSAWRRHSYRRRGLYSVQLQNLWRHFDASQVLILRSGDLARRHGEVLQQVFEFLNVRAHPGIEAETVFEGERGGRRHRTISWLLRLSYLPEFARMRQLSRHMRPLP